MRWLNRHVIARLSPRWALRRESDARALKAFYEATDPSRLRKNRTDRRSANAQNDRSLVKLRTQARHLEENLDIASGALDVLIANTVGAGIRPEPQVMLADGEPATGLNTQLLQLFEGDWVHRADVTWQHDYWALQRLMARSWLRDGEVFAQHVIGNVPRLDHGTRVPYSVEALEADFVPVDYNDQATGIRQGIEVNDWGRPRAYHVYLKHPGEQLASGAYVSTPLATKRVGADRMSHLAFTKRLHQYRGMTLFAPVLIRFDDIKEIDESERVAARVAAAMAAYVKRGTPDMYEPPELDENGQPKAREVRWEPGIIFDNLRPGEDVGTIASNRPNNALIPFRDAQLRAGAAGLMTSFSSLSKNYNGTYSAQRQELVEQFVVYRMLSSQFAYRICQPVWDSFVTAALAAGLVDVPRAVDRNTLFDCTHTAPPMVWIDPLKEANALVLQMQWALKSRSRIIRERGDSPDQVNLEIARDQAERERLGIRIGDQAPVPAADDADDESDDESDDDSPDAAPEARRILAAMDAVAARRGRVVMNPKTGALAPQ